MAGQPLNPEHRRRPVPARREGGSHPAASPARRNGGGDFETDVRGYADLFKRRARWAVTVFIAVTALTLIATALQDRVYRAHALLEIRGTDGDASAVENLFANLDPSEEVRRTHVGLLQSRTIADQVIQDLRLDTIESFMPDDATDPRAVSEGFLERLVVDPVEESRLVRVAFDAETPELSADVVNGVVARYTTLRSEARSEEASRLARQVREVEEHLEASEARLGAYALEHDLPYLVEEDLTARTSERLGSLRSRLQEVGDLRVERQSRYDVVVGGGRSDIVENEVLFDLGKRLSELRGEYARLSATFTDDYPAVAALRREIDQVGDLIREERARVARQVEGDYRLALEWERNLARAVDEQERLATELGPRSGEYHLLRQAVLANRTLYTTLHEKQREAEVAAALGTTDLRVVDRATPPPEPHRPAFAMNLALGLMLGLVLGVGAAFGVEVFDDTVHTADDLCSHTDVPVLAMIPSLSAPQAKHLPIDASRPPVGLVDGQPSKASNDLPGRDSEAATRPRLEAPGPARTHDRTLADAFGALRTSVLFKDDGRLPRSILVTSCRVGEGKTTVSVNLARSLAKLDHRVLVVDADLRRPAAHRAVGTEASPGLLDCLRSEGRPWRDMVRPSPQPGLDILPAGGSTDMAVDLLSTERLPRLLKEANRDYDFVVVDAPALFINQADARAISRHVDGVVVVVRSRHTPAALVERIPATVPNVIGVVVNDLHENLMPRYFGRYFSGYGEVEREAPTREGHNGSEAPANILTRFARWIDR